ncbi:hypothetical protein HMPREF0758_0545 [Serratia odorifera DSM 4582]|uniref:Uncharacterized protein n=1 Tax=Serratia odorifera DSM 4582 TaxID=667129 RepID=D4DX95_SEROD|nr:hypothetical protein HMPREF0758_0545 [Serratia odorifera DSM 4582]
MAGKQESLHGGGDGIVQRLGLSDGDRVNSMVFYTVIVHLLTRLPKTHTIQRLTH